MSHPQEAGSLTWGSTQLKMTTFLGKGSFGTVYIGEVVGSNPKQEFAVKILDRDKIKSKRAEEEVQAEQTSMRRLARHPRIVQMHHFKATAHHYYIVMDVYSKGSLYKLMKDQEKQTGSKRFPEKVCRGCFQDVISGLAYAHKNGMAHRDLKPGNIFVDSRGHCCVGDLGLVKMRQHATEGALDCKTLCGTPVYFAPELVALEEYKTHDHYDGKAVDMWALGVMLFELLAGRRPFPKFDDGKLPKATFDRNLNNDILNADYKMSHCIPPACYNLVRGLLEKDPAKRFTIDQVLEDDWFKEGFDAEKELYRYLPSSARPAALLSPTSATSAAAGTPRYSGGTHFVPIVSPTTTSAASKAKQQQQQQQQEEKEKEKEIATTPTLPNLPHVAAAAAGQINNNNADDDHHGVLHEKNSEMLKRERLAVSPSARKRPISPHPNSNFHLPQANNNHQQQEKEKKEQESPRSGRNKKRNVPHFMQPIHHHQPRYRPSALPNIHH